MPRFEEKLKMLFDAQDFFRDPDLDKAIGSASLQPLGLQPLADDELAMLFAAGEPFLPQGKDGESGDN